MTNQEKTQIQEIKCRLKEKYPILTESEIETAYNLALADFLVKKYPSENNRPTPEELRYDFITLQNLYKRMDYLCGGSGIPIGVKEYSENGMKFVFDTTVLADFFDIGLPKAGVPK